MQLTLLDLLLALGLMAATVALSAWQRLGLTRQWAIAAGRAVLQLLAVGYLLAAALAGRSLGGTLLLWAALVALGTFAARSQIGARVPGLLSWLAAGLAGGSALAVGYLVLAVVRPPVWSDPQVAVPLAGVVLGGAANSAAIAGERLLASVRAGRAELETRLCLGATPQQAIAPYRREAIRAALLPALNGLLSAGVVGLPVFFGGATFGGIPPLSAAGYQVAVLFALALASAIAAIAAAAGVARQCFAPGARLSDL